MTKLLIDETDIAGLNRRAVQRGAVLARRAATALVVVGVVLVLSWAWTFVRLQWRLDSGCRGSTVVSGMTISGPCVRAVDRLDATAGALSGLYGPASAIAVGFALRVLVDAAVARTGGSVTGVAVGDLLEVDALDDDDDDHESARDGDGAQ